MAAKDCLGPQCDLYHGTGGEIEGGVIQPRRDHYQPNLHGEGAYSTTSLPHAELYAENEAIRQGRLFGTVFKVSPVSEARPVREGSDIHLDTKGMKTEEAVSFPTNPDIIKYNNWIDYKNAPKQDTQEEWDDDWM
jgi:hypothetical protein